MKPDEKVLRERLERARHLRIVEHPFKDLQGETLIVVKRSKKKLRCTTAVEGITIDISRITPISDTQFNTLASRADGRGVTGSFELVA